MVGPRVCVKYGSSGRYLETPPLSLHTYIFIPCVFSLPLSPSFPLSPLLPPALGAAYGTAKSGVGIAAMSVMRPDLIMKSVIPVVMAGIIAIYGLVVSVLVANKRKCVSFYIPNVDSAISSPDPSTPITRTTLPPPPNQLH